MPFGLQGVQGVHQQRPRAIDPEHEHAPRRLTGREPRRPAARPRHPIGQLEGELAERPLEAAPQGRDVAGVARQEAVGLGQAHERSGRSASTTRPAACAPMITPCGQARRMVCQPQPASTRSSCWRPGAPAAAQVAGPGAAAAGVGRPGQRSQAGVGRGAPVVEPGRGQVDDRPAGGPQALEPFLLVAVRPDDALVEVPDPLHRRAANGEVRPPDHARLAVLGPEVQRGDRRVLAAASTRPAALEAGPDGPAEGLRLGVARGAGGQSVQPAGRHQHVVVHEGHQRARALADAGVAGGVEAARPPVAHAAHLRPAAPARGWPRRRRRRSPGARGGSARAAGAASRA